MQELSNSIKTPNLRIIGIKGEEVQTKGIHNIFNKIMAGNLPNLKKELPVQVPEASRTRNKLDQNKTSPQHFIINTNGTENRGKMLKAVRVKKQIMYKGKPSK
jgi:hypothetical protein